MKKLFNYLAIFALCAISTACGKNSITPTTENIKGELGDYFEVVSKDYSVNNDGKLYVEIKRIKEGMPQPWQKGVGVGQSNGECEPTFTVEYLTADGNTVSKTTTSLTNNRSELQSLIELAVGETSTVTLDCVGEAIAKFKVNSDYKYNGELERTMTLAGNIGKYPVVMTIHIDVNGDITGAYFYQRKGRGNYLYLTGEKSGKRISINEFTAEGNHTGTFNVKLLNEILKGRFDTWSGNYPLSLMPSDEKPIDLSTTDFSSFSADYIGDEYSEGNNQTADYTSSSDWDSLLDSYDSYVTKYISLMKKAAKGDMNALSEYPALLEKAQEFGDKMENAKGDMSTSQWARYMKITNKMATAASQM